MYKYDVAGKYKRAYSSADIQDRGVAAPLQAAPIYEKAQIVLCSVNVAVEPASRVTPLSAYSLSSL